MTGFYKKLVSEFDKDIVDAVLAVSAKKGGGIPDHLFQAEVFAETTARCCSDEYLAKIEGAIAYYANMPGSKVEKLEVLKRALKQA